VDSDTLKIGSIEDFRAYQTLLTLALRSRRSGGLRRDDPVHRLMRGFRVELADGAVTENPYLQSPRFILHRVRKAA
jgi:hypothetical protein